MGNFEKGPKTSSTRRNRLLREREHDPYKLRLKLSEPALCPECGVVFHKGRWQWMAPPAGAHETLCPACQRTQDKCPAGYLTLSGPFLKEHREEILNLAHNVEARQKTLHPLQRIMAIEEQQEDGILITTTEASMARTLGDAIHHAYQGELEYQYTDGASLLEVYWKR